jgi:replicative DNA helicase
MHDIKVEKALLGAIVCDNEIKYELRLEVSDFYDHLNQQIYKAMMSMDVINILLLDSALCGKCTEYLASLDTWTSVYWQKYEKIIKELSQKRRLKSLFVEQSHALATNSSEEVKSSLISYITDNTSYGGVVKVGDGLHEIIEDVEKGNVTEDGVLTGIRSLDNVLGCLAWGELYYLGARPSMGKTSLALNIIANASSDIPVMMFALETTTTILQKRLLCIMGDASMSDTMKRKNNDSNIPRLIRGAGLLHDLPIYIDDTGGLSIEDFEKKVRVAQRQYGIKFVVVDYLTLMTTKKQGSTYETVTHISKELKRIAKDTGIPFLVLCQLNRQLEQRNNKRPMQSDFRDSGQIEQDGEAILGLYRDEVYNPETDAIGMAEIIVLKNKNGATGYIESRFDKISMRFS